MSGMFDLTFRRLEEALPGFRAAAVVGSDGIEIEAWVRSELPHEVLSAELNGLLRNLDRLQSEIGIGVLEEMAIRTSEENLLMLRLSPELFILAITDASQPTGKARYEIQRLAHLFLAQLA
ncbi:MAG: hypothetical protein JHC34_05965 [Acidobacteria bacterium]|jgi:predicted regulator of Ras-like GTPase activity (Roadblock/LC7/MglB family)|nr:hypothetical protein [Acidobacteriota bacterium]